MPQVSEGHLTFGGVVGQRSQPRIPKSAFNQQEEPRWPWLPAY